MGFRGNGLEGSEGPELEARGVRSRGVAEEFLDEGFVDRWFWCGDSLDAVGGVDGAPGLDESAERVVRSEVREEGLLRDGTRVVLRHGGEEPLLDAVAVVGDAGGDGHGVLHEL